MVDIKYANAYSEVLEILKYIPLENYNKIPKNKIELFKVNANNDYSFTYNPSKTLEEQKVSKITKGIIAILYRDYWATPYQKERIEAKEKYDRQKLEEERREQYNPDDIFKKKKEDKLEYKPSETTAITVVQEEKWYKKIFNIIKSLFHRN